MPKVKVMVQVIVEVDKPRGYRKGDELVMATEGAASRLVEDALEASDFDIQNGIVSCAVHDAVLDED